MIGDEARALEKPIKGVTQEELLDYVIEMQDEPEDVPKETREIIMQADSLLEKPFNFYSTSLMMNQE